MARRSTARASSRSEGGPKAPGPLSCIAPNPIRLIGLSPSNVVLFMRLLEHAEILEPSTTLGSLAMTSAKKIGFLSFGAWHPGGGLTHTGGDALHQTVELAIAAEEIGIDGAFVRVHHFARQLASPFPLLSAIGVKTSRIEIGTGVIDMRYENPLYMAETAAAADLLADGRLQLGVSRGSPEPAWHGAEAFGYSIDHDEAREKTALFRAAIAGA